MNEKCIECGGPHPGCEKCEYHNLSNYDLFLRGLQSDGLHSFSRTKDQDRWIRDNHPHLDYVPADMGWD